MRCLTQVVIICLFPCIMAAQPHNPKFTVRVEHFSALREVLKAGDSVYAFCIRTGDESGAQKGKNLSEPVWNEGKFSKSIEMLNEVKFAGIEKAVIFSSVEDLKNNIKRLPKEVSWVMYDSERGMTPSNELKDLEKSVRDFGETAHKNGLLAGWGPTMVMIKSDEIKLLKLAVYIDRFGLQHQKLLQLEGFDAFVSETKRRASIIKTNNPKCSVTVQVVLGRSSVEESVKALIAVKEEADMFSIWTMQDTEGAVKAISLIRGKAGNNK